MDCASLYAQYKWNEYSQDREYIDQAAQYYSKLYGEPCTVRLTDYGSWKVEFGPRALAERATHPKYCPGCRTFDGCLCG